ncbi:endonuclease/exonuclease/phosphatase family protein [Antarctobacter heliothermus]|uniref:Metal-dependent hydrolase, endonuclease/exonuclease/phosphatase family n=1 Tax=Antarctobacter heliothermus TaxID=74033 RepID=A0A239GG21_9RHOB|nr:endonuclease/exonuclease/phosphatase family protein [Antarctobacter heliothermus]SNS68246.1 Metal-dependent hydrolase, endonuclease/exonuclease/phosphatase family [Antarctobacter heliothermus]
MRALLVLVMGLVIGCGSPPAVPQLVPQRSPDHLRVATHNVHFIHLAREHGPWSVADWEVRKHALDAVFKEADADLMAFQEMVSIGPDADRSTNLARDWLLARNPDYAVAASGDWRRFPTRQPIFYRTDRLRVIDQGWFLHEPPDVIAKERRMRGFWLYYSSWADFEDRRGQRLRVYNVHFHFHRPARRRHAARTVLAHMAPVLSRGVPVLVMGDMNALSGWRTVDILRGGGFSAVEPRSASFHFNRGLHLFGPIDRIASTPDLTVSAGPWAVRGRRVGDWPSDHYPVVADLTLP